MSLLHFLSFRSLPTYHSIFCNMASIPSQNINCSCQFNNDIQITKSKETTLVLFLDLSTVFRPVGLSRLEIGLSLGLYGLVHPDFPLISLAIPSWFPFRGLTSLYIPHMLLNVRLCSRPLIFSGHTLSFH